MRQGSTLHNICRSCCNLPDIHAKRWTVDFNNDSLRVISNVLVMFSESIHCVAVWWSLCFHSVACVCSSVFLCLYPCLSLAFSFCVLLLSSCSSCVSSVWFLMFFLICSFCFLDVYVSTENKIMHHSRLYQWFSKPSRFPLSRLMPQYPSGRTTTKGKPKITWGK